MKRATLSIVRVLLLGCLVLSAKLWGAAPAEAKWQSLFNGHDLAGWVPVHDATFDVNEGNLRLVKGLGWLRTEKEYKDFVLEFEWRALEEQYDSGILLRAGLEGKPWPTNGWQLNLRYNQIGGLIRGSRTMVPAETPKVPVRQWVKFRVEVKGKHVKLAVDGEDAWETDAMDAERGFIGIQAENKPFEFRNLRVSEL